MHARHTRWKNTYAERRVQCKATGAAPRLVEDDAEALEAPRHLDRTFEKYRDFFFALVTGPRRSLRLKLSDTRVYEPQKRTRLGPTAPVPTLVEDDAEALEASGHLDRPHQPDQPEDRHREQSCEHHIRQSGPYVRQSAPYATHAPA